MRKSSIFLLLLLISFLCHSLATLSFANDTDLYMSSGEGVEPNILIMFDNSGSMNDEVQAYYYDPAVLYPPWSSLRRTRIRSIIKRHQEIGTFSPIRFRM